MQYHGADDENLLDYVMSTSADGKRLIRDEGSPRSRGAIGRQHLDDAQHQRGRAKGFFGQGSNSGAPDGQIGADHINGPRTRRNWAPGTNIAKRGPTGNVRARHPMQKLPPYYGGGGRDTQ
jgi:hypothetical protein